MGMSVHAEKTSQQFMCFLILFSKEEIGSKMPIISPVDYH